MAYQIREYFPDHTRSIFTGVDPNGNVLISCVILELPWLDNAPQISCIPEMLYTVKRRNSSKFKDHYHILDVPDRGGILQHPGNFTKDIRGCQIPGTQFTHLDKDGIPDIINTRATLNKMMRVMGEEYLLHIGSFNRPKHQHSIPVHHYSTIPTAPPIP